MGAQAAHRVCTYILCNHQEKKFNNDSRVLAFSDLCFFVQLPVSNNKEGVYAPPWRYTNTEMKKRQTAIFLMVKLQGICNQSLADTIA